MTEVVSVSSGIAVVVLDDNVVDSLSSDVTSRVIEVIKPLLNIQ